MLSSATKKGYDDEEEDYPFFLKDEEEDAGWHVREKEVGPLERKEDYAIPDQMPKEIWEKARPYFIPFNHPVKPFLDKIFSQGRPLTNSESLKAAGFAHTRPEKFSKVIVTSHPEVKDYLFKIFTDDQDVCEWEHWITRIEGARSLKQTIENFDQTHRFTVPNKWIYPLPNDPARKAAKNFILVVEDAKLIDAEKNRERWKTQISRKDLDALHSILDKEGLSDTVYPFNLHYTVRGKFAFIDTQKHHNWPVPYHRLNPYLSDQNQQYWKVITKQ